MTTGVIYIGRDNVVYVQCLDDGAPVSLKAMTKASVTTTDKSGNWITVNSADKPELFVLDKLAKGIIGLKFGSLPALTKGDHKIRVVIFDKDNPNGITWQHEDNIIDLELRVIKD